VPRRRVRPRLGEAMRRLVFPLVLSLVVVSAVALRAWRPSAQESEEAPSSKVTEPQLQTFIAVYGAMQVNHDLTIEEAIAPYHIGLEDFRQIERHVQAEPRLVERVRQALLTQAESQSALGSATGSEGGPGEPTPTATATRRQKSRSPGRAR
jgi:hypothetical protein